MKEYHLSDKHGTLLAILHANTADEAKAQLNNGFQDQVYYIDEVLNEKVR